MFRSVFPSGSVNTISRVKRSFGVILAIFGHFCKTEKARIGAISWADIGSVWPPLLIFEKLARWHPMQKSYSRFEFHDNHAFLISANFLSTLDSRCKFSTSLGRYFSMHEGDKEPNEKNLSQNGRNNDDLNWIVRNFLSGRQGRRFHINNIW